ncbi:MAG: hypothetical protein Q7S29_02900 [Candidatus Peribacter sp.]|nr:hypothetical protein [Candidatus Peribacter sp.]
MTEGSLISPMTNGGAAGQNIRPRMHGVSVALHWLILAGTYGFLILKAFLVFRPTYDFVWYHLPHALRLFHLTTFTYQPSLILRMKYFPPLAHLVQGFSVWVTGRMSAANGVGMVGLMAAVLAMFLIFRNEKMVRWFLTFCLAVPLIVLHMTIGYIDLFTGCMLLIGFVGFLGMTLRLRLRLSGFIFVAGLTAAMFSKALAWMPAIIFGLFGFVQIVRLVRSHDITARLGWALGLTLLIGIGAFPTSNFLRYGSTNPDSYVPFTRLVLTRPSDPILNTPALPPIVRGRMPPIPFLLSAFEINRLFSDEPYHWSFDENFRPGSQHERMGGWFFVTVCIATVLLLIGFGKKIIPRFPLAAFFCAIAGISTILLYLELRYALFIPLIAAFLLSAFWDGYPRIIRLTAQTALILCALYVASQLPADFWSMDTRPPEAFAPPEARAFWIQHQNEKLTEPIPIKRAGSMSIFWSGPTFSEIPVIVTDEE